jgi:hypothetical protein
MPGQSPSQQHKPLHSVTHLVVIPLLFLALLMSDFIGRIPVSYPSRSSAPSVNLPVGATPLANAQFPLLTDYMVGMAQDWPIVEHRFGSLSTFAIQRFQVGVGHRRFQFQRGALSFSEKAALLAFYNSVQGSYPEYLARWCCRGRSWRAWGRRRSRQRRWIRHWA